jgi:hypothetical protein
MKIVSSRKVRDSGMKRCANSRRASPLEVQPVNMSYVTCHMLTCHMETDIVVILLDVQSLYAIYLSIYLKYTDIYVHICRNLKILDSSKCFPPFLLQLFRFKISLLFVSIIGLYGLFHRSLKFMPLKFLSQDG